MPRALNVLFRNYFSKKILITRNDFLPSDNSFLMKSLSKDIELHTLFKTKFKLTLGNDSIVGVRNSLKTIIQNFADSSFPPVYQFPKAK